MVAVNFITDGTLYELTGGDHTFWRELENDLRQEPTYGSAPARFALKASEITLGPSHHTFTFGIQTDEERLQQRTELEHRSNTGEITPAEAYVLKSLKRHFGIETEESQSADNQIYYDGITDKLKDKYLIPQHIQMARFVTSLSQRAADTRPAKTIQNSAAAAKKWLVGATTYDMRESTWDWVDPEPASPIPGKNGEFFMGCSPSAMATDRYLAARKIVEDKTTPPRSLINIWALPIRFFEKRLAARS